MLIVVIFKDKVATHFKWILHFFKERYGNEREVIKFVWCVSVFLTGEVNGAALVPFQHLTGENREEAGDGGEEKKKKKRSDAKD